MLSTTIVAAGWSSLLIMVVAAVFWCRPAIVGAACCFRRGTARDGDCLASSDADTLFLPNVPIHGSI